jgi:hypothetical protein
MPDIGTHAALNNARIFIESQDSKKLAQPKSQYSQAIGRSAAALGV